MESPFNRRKADDSYHLLRLGVRAPAVVVRAAPTGVGLGRLGCEVGAAWVCSASALLRIFTTERARDGARPLYQSIVLEARQRDLAGATVLRGPLGYGETRRLHNAAILDLSDNLPVVVELVDTEEKLRDFCRVLDGMGDIGLVTLEKVEVLHYGRASLRKD